MDRQLQAIVTLLALINPAMCAAIFVRGTGGLPRRTQMASATTAALTVLVILVLAALFGANILHAFGVSLDAFSVAGGGVLAWIGFGMLHGGDNSGDEPPEKQETAPQQSSLTPLILFAASPGTITGVITLAVAHSKLQIPVTALVAVAVAAATMWLVLLLVVYFSNRGSSATEANPHRKQIGFVRDTVTRFMGLIVIAMGVQFALAGIRAFMKG